MSEFHLAYLSAYYYILKLDTYLIANDYNTELDTYLSENNFKTWALITAYNPKSVVMCDEENKANNLNLKNDLGKYFLLNTKSGSKKELFKERNKETKPDKFEEYGFIAFNIPKNIAINLASKYNQNAILFGEINKKSELIFI